MERFGEQLLEAVNYLDQEGISHRDVKPENLGIGSISGGGKLRLVLFDFSLARTPADNIRAGTPPYLEPFPSQRRPQRWDTHAERYAVAVTLYQMATGQRPVWGDGVSDPAQLDCEATLDAEKCDAVIREPLLDFFRKALKREFRQRFDNAEEMLRGGNSILVAQSAELADYGAKLGEKADELAVLDPLPNPIRVVEHLRAINSPAGAPPLPEPALVARGSACVSTMEGACRMWAGRVARNASTPSSGCPRTVL